MKYCYECGRITAGEPVFCQFCGRSYDVKLCQRHHPNPRNAEVCSQCGSRDLSTPQPKVSFWWHVFEVLVKVLLAVLLTYASLAFVVALFSLKEVQNTLICLGLLLALLWCLWGMLPQWFRKAIRWTLKRGRGHKRHGEGG